MLLLALDTCDSRGSIALLREREVLGEIAHPAKEEFSSWLLPAVQDLLVENRISHGNLAGYAVAAGPGSFTGVRVGLATVKAWSEVYSKPIFQISRLRVLTEAAPPDADFAATFIDAQRNQIFAALYRRGAQGWQNVIQESVISPLDYFGLCLSAADDSRLAWISLDPGILTDSAFWHTRRPGNQEIFEVRRSLAAEVGKLALLHSETSRVDGLTLDANYVRRSDAEIFGKKAAGK